MRARLKRYLSRLRRLPNLFWAVERRSIHHRLERIDLEVAAFRQHIPAFLNSISNVGALGLELRRTATELQAARQDIAQLWARLEFVRKEMMYEMHFGALNPENKSHADPRILSMDKVAQARRDGLKLNIGCGHVPLDEYINIDSRELPGVDVIADVGDLPFEQGCVLEISSTHVLEHFPQERLRRLLRYWRELLAPDGLFRAVVPDGEAMLQGIASSTYPFEHFRMVLFGAQEYAGDFHYNLLTPDSLKDLLEEAGFKAVTVPVRARKNDICFEFEIRAERG
jgi:predicted SAM-dependent methyltransferase